MTPDDRDILIEAAVTAYRGRDASGFILPSPAWMDLSPEDRSGVFEVQTQSRKIETAYHPRGLNSTMRAVIEKAHAIAQLESLD